MKDIKTPVKEDPQEIMSVGSKSSKNTKTTPKPKSSTNTKPSLGKKK
jgi:hypothetical protein